MVDKKISELTGGNPIQTTDEIAVNRGGTNFKVNTSTLVAGPSSATDEAIPRYDSTTGKILQDSNVKIDDTDNVTGAASITTDTLIVNQTSTDAVAPLLETQKARGTVGSETAISNNDPVLDVRGQGFDGTVFKDGFQLEVLASQAWSGSANGTDFAIKSVKSGATALTNRVRVNAEGSWGFGLNSPLTGDGSINCSGLTVAAFSLNTNMQGSIGSILTVSQVSGAVGRKAQVICDAVNDAFFTADRGTTTDNAFIEFKTAGALDWLIGLDDTPIGDTSNFSIKTTINGTPQFVFTTAGDIEIGSGGDVVYTGGGEPTGLPAIPVGATSAISKAFFDAQNVQGAITKANVDLATTANVTLSGEQTIDDILTSVLRILVKNQTDATENGIYITDASAWTRTTDLDNTGSPEIFNGVWTVVVAGTANAGVSYRITSTGTGTDGVHTLTTDDIDWDVVFVNVVAGDGIDKTGATISADINTTNLKFTSTEIDTIQGISTAASPTFAGGTFSGLINANANIQSTGALSISTAAASNLSFTAGAGGTVNYLVSTTGNHNFQLGTGNFVVDTNTFFIDANTGLASFGSALGVKHLDVVDTGSAGSRGLGITNFADSPVLAFRTANGTEGSQTATVLNDLTCLITANGHNASTITSGGRIFNQATETWDGSGRGNKWVFSTTANNSNTLLDRMAIQDDGNVSIGTTATVTSKFQVSGGGGNITQTLESLESGLAFIFQEYTSDRYNSNTTRNNASWQTGIFQGTVATDLDRWYVGRTGISSTDLVVDRQGRVGIGTASATRTLEVVVTGAAADRGISSTNYAATPFIQFKHAAGTEASPTATTSGTDIGILATLAFGTSFSAGGRIVNTATETWDATGHGNEWSFSTVANNSTSLVDRLTIGQDGGLVVGLATGGSQGIGTLNAVGVFDDGVLLTCYVIEDYINGEVDLEKWNGIGHDGFHDPANRYVGEDRSQYLDVEVYSQYFKENRHLPSFPAFEEYEKMSVGSLSQRLWETVEFQAIHISELHDRLAKVEKLLTV